MALRFQLVDGFVTGWSCRSCSSTESRCCRCLQHLSEHNFEDAQECTIKIKHMQTFLANELDIEQAVVQILEPSGKLRQSIKEGTPNSDQASQQAWPAEEARALKMHLDKESAKGWANGGKGTRVAYVDKKSSFSVCTSAPGLNACSQLYLCSLGSSMVSRCFRMRTSAGCSDANFSLACTQSTQT